MLSFKPAMRKNLTVIFISLSLMSFAQFEDNVFQKAQSATVQEDTSENNTFDSQSKTGVPIGDEQEEGPGNPGEPVPVDGLVPILLLSSILLIVYYQKKYRKINI